MSQVSNLSSAYSLRLPFPMGLDTQRWTPGTRIQQTVLFVNSMNHLSFRISFLRARRRMVEMGTDLGIRNRSTLTLVVSLVTVIDFLPWRGRKSRDCLLCNVFGMLLLLP
ncbi:hypothetical protein ABKN59_011114 [Abortiporus biennis]